MQLKLVFSIFQKFSSQIGGEDALQYAYELLLPLYKVCEEFTGKIISGKDVDYVFEKLGILIKQIAEMGLDFLFYFLGQKVKNLWTTKSFGPGVRAFPS